VPSRKYFDRGIVGNSSRAVRNRAFFVFSRNRHSPTGSGGDITRVARELGVAMCRRSVSGAPAIGCASRQLIGTPGAGVLVVPTYDRDSPMCLRSRRDRADHHRELAPGIISARCSRRGAGCGSARRLEPHDARIGISAALRVRIWPRRGGCSKKRSRSDPANSMAFSDLSFASHFVAVFGWDDDPAGRSPAPARRLAGGRDRRQRRQRPHGAGAP